MPQRPKDKGTAHETNIVRWLHNNGFPSATRLPLVGGNDQGDITLTPHPYRIILQAKNVTRAATGQPPQSQLESWMNDTKTQARYANATLWALVVKRKGTTIPANYFAYTHHQNLLDALDAPVTTPNPDTIIQTTLKDLTAIYTHWLQRHPK